MRWTNVKLILFREVRDQLRDRRTLFMIAVLPLLLYPLLGMSFSQVMHFLHEHPTRVLVVGAPQSGPLPPLVDADADRFAKSLFPADDSAARDLLHVTAQEPAGEPDPKHDSLEQARRDMHEGNYNVVVYFPADFAARYQQFHDTLAQTRTSGEEPDKDKLALPPVSIYPNLSQDAARASYRRVFDVIHHWREEIGKQNLVESKVPPVAARPFDIVTKDTAKQEQHTAAVWSKILPFVLLLWALTGAFYPAIDLCAGEKERGTLETLLSSPAERLEIVWGKLLTVMLFSIATAVLNLTSLTVTGSLVLTHVPNMGPPPTLAIVWLLVALVPMSALFAALCLALAAFARSTKEGQYYLMPLVLITLPLVILPMAPGVELTLGNSLIPITGVMLLLRAMLEGNYLAVLPYTPVVIGVTGCCCWLAMRWATDQFNSESVLFRESERWDLSLWVRHLVRDRADTPSFAEAMFCGVLILLVKFFMSFSLPVPHSFADLANIAAVTQLVVILTPALLMTVMLTRNPVQTLLLKRPSLAAGLAAVLLAVVIDPATNLLQSVVNYVYPLNDQLAQALNQLVLEPSSMWLMLAVLAVLPAVCEELAFRGFILSGLRHMGHKWTAIVISSVFFGAAHAIFQQSIVASLVGLILGFMAIQTGSLLPGVLFHVTHNSLALLLGQVVTRGDRPAWLDWLVRDGQSAGPLYHWPLVIASLGASAAILYWFHRLPYARTPEETLQEAIDHQSANWLAG